MNKSIFRILTILALAAFFSAKGSWASAFVPFGNVATPFSEESMMGLAAPSILRSSPSLRLIPAFASFYNYNDFSFGYKPGALPDTFIGGIAFNRDLTKTMTLAGSFRFLSVDAIQNITGGVFQGYTKFQTYSLAPSFAYKFLPNLSAAVGTEISLLEAFGNKNLDFNMSLSGAFELKKKLWIVDSMAFGAGIRNLVGIFETNTSQFQFIGSATGYSWNDRISYGFGFNFVPRSELSQQPTFSVDFGASVFLFNIWRISLGLVNLGKEDINFSASTSIQISSFQFSYTIRNIAQNSAAFVDGSKFEQMFGLSVFYAPSLVGDTSRMLKNLKKIQELMDRGRAAVEAKKYNEGIEIYQAVLKLDKQFTDAKSRLDETKSLLAKLIDSSLSEGRKAYEGREYLASLKEFGTVLNYDAKNEVALRYSQLARQNLAADKKKFMDQATAYYSGKRYNEALSPIDSALLIDPDDKKAKDLKVAIEKGIAERGSEREKIAKTQELLALGDNELEKRNYDEAERFYRQSTEYTTTAEGLKTLIARIQAKREKDAVLDKANDLYLKGKDLLENQGKIADGLDLLSQAVALQPGHTESQALMEKYDAQRKQIIGSLSQDALKSLSQNDYLKAKELWSKALLFDGKNSEIQRYLKSLDETVSKKFSEFTANGAQFEKQGNLGLARIEYQKALALKPTDENLKNTVTDLSAKLAIVIVDRRDKAVALFDQKKYAEAKAALSDIIKEFGEDAKTQEYLEKIDFFADADKQYANIELQYNNRNFKPAQANANKLFAVRPDYPGLKDLKTRIDAEMAKEMKEEEMSRLFQDGVAEFKRKNFDKAIEKWNQVAAIDKNNELVQEYVEKAKVKRKETEDRDLNEGFKAVAAKDYLTARDCFKRALSVNAQNEQAQKNLSDVNFALENMKKEVETKAGASFKSARYAEALGGYETIKKIDGEAFAGEDLVYRARMAMDFLSQAEAAQKERRSADALSLYSRVLVLNPDDAVAQKQVADISTALRRDKDKMLTEAEGYFDRGFFDKAIERWKFLVKQELVTGNDKIDIEERIASAEKRKKNLIDDKTRQASGEESVGRLGRASDLYREILELDPANVTARRKLDTIRAQMEAVRVVQVEQTRRNVNDLFDQGISYYKLENYAEAIASWEQVLAQNPGDAKAKDYIQRAKSKLYLKGK